MMYRPVLVIAALAVFLAGCGGGRGAHVLPPGQVSSGSSARVAQSTNVAFFSGTLWYGDGHALYGVPLTNGASTAEIDGSYAGLATYHAKAMTIAPDGTAYELIKNDAGTVGWQLRIYAPGTHGAATPEETISGTGYPQQVSLAADGIDVLWSTSARTGGGSSTLSTFAYGAGNDPQPIRTLSLGPNVSDVAIGTNDQIYVAHDSGGGVTVYPASAKCACAPVRTIATELAREISIAVAQDGTVYVLTLDPSTLIANINAYAPGNNGSTPSRAIGPFYTNAGTASGNVVSTPTGGITVDAVGDLYAGFAKDDVGPLRVQVYAPNSSGGGAPARTIVTPASGTSLTSIAIGPVTPSAPTAPTLYVASGDQVVEFAAGASGNAAPQRAFGSFYSYPYPEHYKSTLTAIVAVADGSLDALTHVELQAEDYCGIQNFTSAGTFVASVTTSDGNGGSSCESGTAVGGARGPNGEVDVLVSGHRPGEVVRVLNDVEIGSFTLAPATSYRGIAVNPNGDVYVAGFGGSGASRIDKYPAGSVDGAQPEKSFPLDGVVGSMCIAPDKTLYVASEIQATPGGTRTDYVYAIPPHGSAPGRTLGPFEKPVTALACDARGDVYVALSQTDGSESKVKVFPPNADSGTAALRVLTDPIPANDPSGRTIVSLALSP